MKILVLNSGSSSQKACLYEIGETLPDYPSLPLWEGRIEWGSDTAAISVKNSKGGVQKENLKVRSREEFVRHLLDTLDVGPARCHRVSFRDRCCGSPRGARRPAFRGSGGGYARSALCNCRCLHACAASHSCGTRRHGHCRESSRAGPADRRLRYRLLSPDAAVLPKPTRVRTTGSRAASAATDSTVSITATAPDAPLNCSGRSRSRSK